MGVVSASAGGSRHPPATPDAPSEGESNETEQHKPASAQQSPATTQLASQPHPEDATPPHRPAQEVVALSPGVKSSYARVASPMSVAATFPAVRTSTFTACAALAASPGNSEVASVSAAPVPAPRPVWQYPQLRSQLCLHSQSGHRNASQAPRRAANASHRATGARSAHPESTKASPEPGSSVT